MTDPTDSRKAEAAAWFRLLRDRIVAAFEGLEDRHAEGKPGRFEVTPTNRAESGGGGIMSVMRGGGVFEKVGVNVSTVHGRFAPGFAGSINGASEADPGFTATGISLVAHMANPQVPAVHMNTRFLTTSKAWFGGGGDLNPMVENPEDTRAFHAAFKQA